MRTKVIEPTNGSSMILNASAGERRLVVGGTRYDLVGAGLDAFDRGDVERRRQIIDDSVEQRLHALVLERRAAHHGNEMQRSGAFADAAP